MELGLTETPEALAPDPNLRLVGDRESRPLGRDTPIENLFEEAGGRLLILGEPGAGKTTMMLRLAHHLVGRAREDDTEPVPVMVNLASWARHGGSIREWLVDHALEDEANVREEGLARTLVQGNRLLLLLDGLDEVGEAQREDCIAAINDYSGERPRRVVVCSRTEEYEQSGEQLALEKAVRIEPLEPDQVIRELKAHPETEGLRAMLREDDLLRGLATTPLNVSMMMLAYGGKPPSKVHAATKAERRRLLWDDYVTRMIARKPTDYAPESILKWLSWLATKMRGRDMTRFIPDRMQPTWLDRLSSFKWTISLIFGMFNGLSLGSIFGPMIGGQTYGPISGPVYGLGLGLVFGLALGLGGGVVLGLANWSEVGEEIQLFEKVRWVWDWSDTDWEKLLFHALGVGLAWALMFWMNAFWLGDGLPPGFTHSLAGGLIFLGGGLIFGLTTVGILHLYYGSRVVSAIEKAQSPGDRLHVSRQNGLTYGLAGGLLFGLFFGLLFGLIIGPVPGVAYGLGGGLGGVLAGFLENGGGEALKFDVLRFFLWREEAIPWRYFKFLKEAADLLLLEQVGGAVEFRHLLLRDYFADLTPERIGELSSRIEHVSPG